MLGDWVRKLCKASLVNLKLSKSVLIIMAQTQLLKIEVLHIHAINFSIQKHTFLIRNYIVNPHPQLNKRNVTANLQIEAKSKDYIPGEKLQVKQPPYLHPLGAHYHKNREQFVYWHVLETEDQAEIVQHSRIRGKNKVQKEKKNQQETSTVIECHLY